NPNEGCSVEILPAYGAMLHAFTINTPAGPHNCIDNYAGAAAIEKELDSSFKSSKLSPFVCRIPGGRYNYDGEIFELQKKFMDGSAIHGLLYNKPFKKFSQFADEEKASVALRYHYKEEDDGYPFDYTCEIRYTLMPQNTLQLQTTVTNLDDLEIPICDGWHPYFALGGNIDDQQLFFVANALLEFDERLVPTGKLIPYNHFASETRIGDTRLDNCFALTGDDSYAACTLRNPANGLQLNIFPDSTYPFLQVFTPDHRKSIAIENLSAAPDAFNNHIGLTMLPARHTKTFTVHYQLSCQ
ncbi:MAG TPA: aldose 1-epimerase, partial [Chitinophagaceae bacterium]|nr:aldose 1-epimerase [Chitinophagaceae bacterium]